MMITIVIIMIIITIIIIIISTDAINLYNNILVKIIPQRRNIKKTIKIKKHFLCESVYRLGVGPT